MFLKCMLKTPWCGSGIDILDANLEVDGVSTVVSSTKVLFRCGKEGGNDVLTGGGDDRRSLRLRDLTMPVNPLVNKFSQDGVDQDQCYLVDKCSPGGVEYAILIVLKTAAGEFEKTYKERLQNISVKNCVVPTNIKEGDLISGVCSDVSMIVVPKHLDDAVKECPTKRN